ncbi:hypothetical protein AXG93_4831s1190 [Marchantia polymorpha subsp. ruderalis]|uniref:Uncharacterized protein n=1 Tax=Marchantia polymorpha subsp. ruderalis TaxID=1480154 RepID=A0A176W8L5_MARPO|nr:hypothetical protein AXG93_4831s1190 [Marchantia polymorpha subsp. ruderalis]
MADALDAVIVEKLKRRVNASPIIALTIDDNTACDLTEYMFQEILFIKNGQRRSSQRWVGFKYHADACNSPGLRMLRVHDVRWLFVKGCLSNIITEYASIIGTLRDDMTSKDPNKKTKLAVEKLNAQFMEIDTMLGCRVLM